MIRSMTGFGRAEVESNNCRVSVEVKSVNNRFLEIMVHLPDSIKSVEDRIKKIATNFVSRGRVDIYISISGSNNDIDEDVLILNEKKAENYYQAYNLLKNKFGLSGDISLDSILKIPDIFRVSRKELDIEKIWDIINEATNKAFEDLQRMREMEGKNLEDDITVRIKNIDDKIKEIENGKDKRITDIRTKLYDRISKLTNGICEIDQSRLAMEVALLVDKYDVTEECVRFRSHNQQFLKYLGDEQSVGRKMNFLIQEMNREATTIGNKVSDADISQQIVEIKEELEKIREQIQNIE